MSSKDPVQKRFRIVLAGCGVFVIAMLGSLAYVCSRPQTPAIQAAEKQTILACKQQSEDAARTEIFRIERRKACAEMQKQYVHKFKELPV
jgi:Na+/H+-dicarboxylate symporter